jgi:anti-sigma factor RsiW
VDLAAEGFPLAGGRVATIDGHTAATLVYERRLHPIEVFIWPAADGEVRPAARAIRGFHVRCWSAEGMAFWVVSDVNDAELDQFAAALRAAK